MMPSARALLVACSVFFAAGEVRSAETKIPFPKALDDAAVSVDRLDSILEYALLVGNGDINALIYSEGGQLRMMLTKNDVWDARLDSKLDPPLPKLEWIEKHAASQPRHGGRTTILQEGWGNHGRDSYHAHPYPCPRPCARLVLSDERTSHVKQTAARLDLRRAVARISAAAGEVPETEIRALAGRNVFLIRSPAAAQLVPIRSADIPEAVSGKDDSIAHLVQEIPGDPDWPGMRFAAAVAAKDGLKAVAIVTSREAEDPRAAAVSLARATIKAETAELLRNHEAAWKKFWAASGVDLDDALLRNAWYQNLYFLRCVSRPGAVAPGLFAGLIHDQPAWHGDYHTNYNIQQTFWTAYVTNHTELAEPYDRLISEYLPRARWLAKEVFSIGGAYYPHVLFAYEPPHPEKCTSPNGRQYIHHVWGFTQGVNGFSVQPLWWHYKYAPDREFLDKTVYPAIRDVAVFQAAFIDRCKGGQQVVLAPSVSPEHWGWTKDLSRNRNCTFDIAMFRYIFAAAIEGATTLGRDAELVERWRQALRRLPAYPTTKGEGAIVVDVEGAPPAVYNIAVPATPVFPGDVVTWFSPAGEKQLFTRTIDRLRFNGNNSALILSVSRARLSMPDTISWMRTEIETRTRPNGTLTLNRRGRSGFNNFGHYTEQFGASMAISELLLQSVGDVIRLFPAWPDDRAAAFRDLRAQGGFLVSAEHTADGSVERIAVTSTVGGKLRLLSPWPALALKRGTEGSAAKVELDGQGIARIETQPGEPLLLQAATP